MKDRNTYETTYGEIYGVKTTDNTDYTSNPYCIGSWTPSGNVTSLGSILDKYQDLERELQVYRAYFIGEITKEEAAKFLKIVLGKDDISKDMIKEYIDDKVQQR